MLYVSEVPRCTWCSSKDTCVVQIPVVKIPVVNMHVVKIPVVNILVVKTAVVKIPVEVLNGLDVAHAVGRMAVCASKGR